MMSGRPSEKRSSLHDSPRNEPSRKTFARLSYAPKVLSPLRNEVFQTLQDELLFARKASSFLYGKPPMRQRLDQKLQTASLPPFPRDIIENYTKRAVINVIEEKARTRLHPGSLMIHPIRSFLNTRSKNGNFQYLVEWHDNECLPPQFQGGRKVWEARECVDWFYVSDKSTGRMRLVPFMSPALHMMNKAQEERDEEERQARYLRQRARWNTSGSPVTLDEIAAEADAQTTDPNLQFCVGCAKLKPHSEFFRLDHRTGRERWHQENCNPCAEKLNKKLLEELEKTQQRVAETIVNMAQVEVDIQELEAAMSEPVPALSPAEACRR
ncbi:hypothetical protein BU16DRAFT_524653 [Lophium mytilinum]|uniref:Uncharacterized protein n=1 Tax=Lophium mytilinum TaxID=390894 RepID=A0A6A6R1Z4_9PEZI|nr:hypothetical protein BU16DRAFT_524653 [Lophium mytilinum]